MCHARRVLTRSSAPGIRLLRFGQVSVLTRHLSTNFAFQMLQMPARWYDESTSTVSWSLGTVAELLWIERDGVLIGRLIVSGPMADEDLDRIGRQLLDSPERSRGKILLDFRKVSFIYSLFIAKLVALQKQCEASNTELKLCSVAPLVMEVIEITRLSKVFAIYSSEQEAMAAF